jgi:general secretion pathway protein E
MEAALTGHMVMSTLHTNDAATAITRLLDMGLEDFLIASTLSLVVAQRLVRTLCPSCKQHIDELKGGPCVAVGCDKCKGKGYVGRMALVEVLPITEEIRTLIRRRADASEIAKAAKAQGMISMAEAGSKLVRQGVTTAEEILRVTREDA